MHNSDFKGFAFVMAKGTNLNFLWGSIQEWGCMQANTVNSWILLDVPAVTAA